MKYTIFFILILFAVLILPDLAFGQVPPPPPQNTPQQTPIDGGLGLLAAAGGAYALNKLRQRKAKQ
jgi:hypothetical protein